MVAAGGLAGLLILFVLAPEGRLGTASSDFYVRHVGTLLGNAGPVASSLEDRERWFTGVTDQLDATTDGTVDSAYEGDVRLTGDAPWPGGSTKGLYMSGTVGNVQDFHAAVAGGQALSDTLGPSLQSNLTAILGRHAATSGREVTWDEMMKNPIGVDPKLQLPKDGPASTA